MIELTDYITLSEAITMAGISRSMMQWHLKHGSAPPYGRIGREVVFRRNEVIKWKTERYPDGAPRKGRKRNGSVRA